MDTVVLERDTFDGTADGGAAEIGGGAGVLRCLAVWAPMRGRALDLGR